MRNVCGLDHVVLAVGDLDRTSEAYEALGFSVTLKGIHPWGTANRLVQLDGFFIEILTVDRPELISESEGLRFSFGAFNRQVLEGPDRASMLVLESDDPEKDRQRFEKNGLSLFDPFSFEREAIGPDGSPRKVGFDLTFVADSLSPQTMFFTCHHQFPDHFWKPDYQRHANGAMSIKGVVLSAAEPASHHEFLGGFSGQREMRATSLGVELDTPRGQITAVTPKALPSLYGVVPHQETGEGLFLQALRIGVKDLAQLRVSLENAAMPMTEFRDTLIIQPSDLFGTAMIFEEIR